MGSLSALGTGGLTVNSGLLDLNGNSIGIASLSGRGGTTCDLSNGGAGTSVLALKPIG